MNWPSFLDSGCVMTNKCELCSVDDQGLIYLGEKWRVISCDQEDYPGFCRVVWNRHVAEMTDLSQEDRQEVMDVVWLVEESVREIMLPDKVNLASLGNMVPHLHWHIIPRYTDDRHFPDSIWSVARREPPDRDIEVWRNRVVTLRRVLRNRLTAKFGTTRQC